MCVVLGFFVKRLKHSLRAIKKPPKGGFSTKKHKII